MQHTTLQDSTGALERCSDTAQATTTQIVIVVKMVVLWVRVEGSRMCPWVIGGVPVSVGGKGEDTYTWGM